MRLRSFHSALLAVGLLLAACTLAGCPDEAGSHARPGAAQAEAAEPPGPDEPDEPTEPLPPPPPLVDKAIDEMTEPELETACFEGRQEACDRLGH